jgi:hypothetical protein
MGPYPGISSRWGFPEWSEIASSKAGQILIGGVAGALLGAAISSKLSLVVLLIGAILAGAAVAAALTYPERVFIAFVLVVALIPTYAAPKMGPILFIPGAGLAWILAGTLAWRNAMQRGRLFGLTAIDLLVVVFFVLMYISSQVSQQVELKIYENDVFAWLGPYLATRLLLQDCKRPAFAVAASFAAATVLVAPVAVLETLGVKNPFLNFQFNSAEAAAFGNTVSRLGEVRAQASFGHPIALSMFVAASALLSLGMAIYAKISKERAIWLGLAAVAIAVQVMTASRTGYLMLVPGVILLGLTTAMQTARKRLMGFFGLVAVLFVAMQFTGALPEELQLFPSGQAQSAAAEEVSESGAYRERLLERAIEPGVLGLWGNPYNKVTNAVSAANTATDNEYIILADSWGLIPTFSLIAIAIALLIAIVVARGRNAYELVILPIAALMSLGALFFVAFITQQQVVIWILIGASSAASERVLRERRLARRQRSAERPPEPPEPQRLEVMPDRW